MGRSRAILHPDKQPGAQLHPELQLQGNGHEAQIIVILILLPGHDTVPVERCAPGRLISTRLDFPDLGESAYENRDLQQGYVLQSFMDQRVLAAPDETQHIWKLDGPLEDVPNDEVPSMAWQHMAHTGPLPPIWDLLDLQPSAETLHLLNLVEFTDLLNGCAPDALVRNAFVILRVVATARYLHLKRRS